MNRWSACWWIGVLMSAAMIAGCSSLPVVEMKDGQYEIPHPEEATIDDTKSDRLVMDLDSHEKISVDFSSIMPETYEVFRRAFHETLLEEGMVESMPETPRSYGGQDGYYSRYEFEHTGVRLDVVVWQTFADDHALTFAGYFLDGDESPLIELLEEIDW